MVLERSLHDARDAGIRLLTACLWASTLALASIGWMLGSQDVWLATSLTVLLNVVPTWCRWKGRSDGAARVSFGIAAALHPAIYVFVFRGHVWQMDMHMYFFAALASLTVLYDRRPLVVAAAIIVVHHLTLQATAPSWAFAGNAEIGRVLLHATLVILQTTVLSMLATRLAKMIRAFEASRQRNEELVLAAAASEDRALAALVERDVDYRLLAEHSSDMIVRIGLDGIRRYVSPACQQLLGYSAEELLGGAPIAAIHVEDRARVADVCRSMLDGSCEPHVHLSAAAQRRLLRMAGSGLPPREQRHGRTHRIHRQRARHQQATGHRTGGDRCIRQTTREQSVVRDGIRSG